MFHESDLEKDIKITDTDITFETILQKKYIPQKYIDDIKKANVLIIPNEGFRDKEGYFFPECTSEFYMFLKRQEGIETEICIDDKEFQNIELHADIIYVATMIIQYVVLPVVTSMIASYLYDKVNSMNKKRKDANTNVHIIVEKNGKSKKIDYEGNIENFEDAMKTLDKTIFK